MYKVHGQPSVILASGLMSILHWVLLLPIHSDCVYMTENNTDVMPETITYNRNVLLQYRYCDSSWDSPALSDLADLTPIIRRKQMRTYRGCRAGRKKQRNITVLTGRRFYNKPKGPGVRINNLCTVPVDTELRMDNNISQPLHLCYMNAQSVRNKTLVIRDYILSNNIDMCAISESWLQQDNEAIIADLIPDGYNFTISSRSDRRGGGTAFIYRNSLSIKVLQPVNKASYEYSEVHLCSKIPVHFALIYRPPQSCNKQPYSVFLSEFSDHLEELLASSSALCIVGDFNLHMDELSKSETVTFNDMLESTGLIQHVSGPTHYLGHTLDLMIT